MLLDWEEAGRRLGQAAGHRGQEEVLAVTVAGERTGSAVVPNAAEEMHFYLCALKLDFIPMACIYILGWQESHWSARMKMVLTEISSSAFYFFLLNP